MVDVADDGRVWQTATSLISLSASLPQAIRARGFASKHRLGLSLCRSIVEAHGGVIEVRDNHPHGAVFRFTLPAEEIEIHE